MTVFWVYHGRSGNKWERGLAWHDWHDATRDQRAIGARGGIGTALPDASSPEDIILVVYITNRHSEELIQ